MICRTVVRRCRFVTAVLLLLAKEEWFFIMNPILLPLFVEAKVLVLVVVVAVAVGDIMGDGFTAMLALPLGGRGVRCDNIVYRKLLEYYTK